MAYKIMHRWQEQELRFPTQTAAEQYVDRFGGRAGNWDIVVAGDAVATVVSAGRPLAIESP